jgi:hypothetical protein
MMRSPTGSGRRADLTDGYVSGPDAATEPRRRSLERLTTASRVVLVEGVTDQIALERVASRTGRDLVDSGVVVAPMGGAHAIDTFLRAIDRVAGRDVVVGGLCDRREAPVFRAALERAGRGPVVDDSDLARLGFFVCDADLEGELIRALGVDRVVELMEAHGDLASFRTLQQQSAWVGQPIEDQLHRFLRSRARRMHRYAREMVDAIDMDRLPTPLVAALAGV